MNFDIPEDDHKPAGKKTKINELEHLRKSALTHLNDTYSKKEIACSQKEAKGEQYDSESLCCPKKPNW